MEPKKNTEPAGIGWNQPRVFLYLSVLLTLLAYLPVMDNQFVNWDDPVYIQQNPHIRHLDLSALSWMLTNFYAGYWMPVTWFSLALDFSLGRLEPWVYHLDNLLLHLLNTALVFLLSLKLLGLVRNKDGHDQVAEPPPWFAPAALGTALLFGLHPIHVESVAWASERKDLLCAFFFFLSLRFYLSYGSQPGKNIWKYFACLGSFILALLSKPMAVSLPFLLLLLDHWPLGRLRSNPSKVLLEKIPFFILALLAGWIAVLSQSQAGAAWGLNASPLDFRFMNACHSTLFYLFKLLFPTELTAFYPILLEKTFSTEYFLSFLGFVLISAVCFIYRKKAPYLAAVWLYYLLTLGPTLGLFQVGNQAAADRFTYIPSWGPSLLLAAVFVTLMRRWRLPILLLALSWAAWLGYGTFRQVSVWKDSISLWENVIRVNPKNNLVTHNNLGKAYEDAGRWDEALGKFEDANAVGAPFVYSRWGKARILAEKGLLDQAIHEYKTAIGMSPQFPPLRSGLGRVYARKKMYPAALAEIQEALRLDQRFAEAHHDLGAVYRSMGKFKEALEAFGNARSLDPDNPKYMRSMIKALERAGKHGEALALYRGLSDHPRSLLTMRY